VQFTDKERNDLKNKFLPLHGCPYNAWVIGYRAKGKKEKTIHIAFVRHATVEFYEGITIISEASRGQGYSVQFKPTQKQLEWLFSPQTVEKYSLEIIDTDLLKTAFENGYEMWKKTHRGNRGNYAEYLMCSEWFVATQNPKYNACFSENTSDILLNGEWVQVKYQGATIYCEKTLNRQWELRFPK
jgi:hypothetical protein